MKKILITILATFALAGVSHAGSFGVGVSGGIIQVDGSGTETTTAGTVSGGAANTNSKDVDAASLIGSVFAEFEFDNGWALGYEHVPGSAEVSDKHTRRSTDEDAAVQRWSCCRYGCRPTRRKAGATADQLRAPHPDPIQHAV